MAGCCYGTPTNMPWGIKYGDHAMPFYTHLNRGFITDSSSLSLAVHPNQLYQTIACSLIAFAIWRMKNFWKRPGNLFFSSITLYWIARFFIEFWRDGASNGVAGEMIYGLKYVQWGLLIGILLMIIFIFFRERKYRFEKPEAQTMIHPIWYYISLCITVLIVRYWFTSTEFIFIEIVLAQTTILQLNKLLRQESRGFGTRLAGMYALIFVFIVSGTVTAQKTYEELTNDKSKVNVFNDVSVGYGNFQYTHYHATPYVTPGCYGSTYTAKGPRFTHNANAIGIGITRTETHGLYQKVTLAGQLSGGWDTQLHSAPKYTVGIFDLAPSLKYDWRWFGLGLGFRFGANVKEEHKSDINFATNDRPKGYLCLSGNIRLFPYDIFYTELRFNDYFPYQLGIRSRDAIQFVVGIGFGKKDGTALEGGYDGIGSKFISAKAFIKNKYSVKATVYECGSSLYSVQMMQLALAYRFSK